MPFSQEDKISKKDKEEFGSTKLENKRERIIVVKVRITAIIKGEGRNLLKIFSMNFVKYMC